MTRVCFSSAAAEQGQFGNDGILCPKKSVSHLHSLMKRQQFIKRAVKLCTFVSPFSRLHLGCKIHMLLLVTYNKICNKWIIIVIHRSSFANITARGKNNAACNIHFAVSHYMQSGNELGNGGGSSS